MSINNWKQIATVEAARQGVPLNIVLATVDAETGGNNELGDNGNALGFGQVWPKWHMENFQFAANELGITLPSSTADLQQLVLNNNQFSMAVAVNTIKEYWTNAKGDWGNFTRGYVGAGIPDSDFKRREVIWNTYNQSGSKTILDGNKTYVGIIVTVIAILGLFWILGD